MACEDREVTTVEGLAGAGGPSTLQDAFDRTGGAQCGFCTPGMLMSATALLRRNPDPSRDEIAHALSGNLCRCTGYTKILDAVELAAREIRERG
jgi:aerobic-type carbon monoxide dehydrogenase small subunit (CoxS/CutS family)